VESTDGSDVEVLAQLTLLGAVNLANRYGCPSAITFDPNVFSTPKTINLQPGQQLELKPVGTLPIWTITGPTERVTVNAAQIRVFQIDNGVTASLSGLTISGGTADRGGGVLNLAQGNLTLTNCTLSGNTATKGGILATYGTALLNDCILAGNTASN